MTAVLSHMAPGGLSHYALIDKGRLLDTYRDYNDTYIFSIISSVDRLTIVPDRDE